jgi:hypothetical protein
MVTSNNSNQRGKSGNTTSANKSRSSSTTRNDNVAMRAARTVRDRPYTSAAIATGAVTAVAAAAAGAFFFTRRDKSFKEASEELTSRVRDGLAGATDKVREFAGRSDSPTASSTGRSQSEIAEEALTLKETGSLDHQSNSEIKAGAIAY